ncbi:MAG: hypothetical protein HXY20_12605 [Acidobacteria bacterium]|nr:hypothetical protein [Acidobacteriota bacterium]
MKCAYHATADAQQFCSTCSKALCAECSHQIKGKYYCQDCLVQGAEWATAVKDLRIPADSPKRAAVCSLIPGMGAVYNNEYMKALTYFAVFAALVIMGDRIHGIFGFAAFAFIVFTMFDSYRSAEARARARLEGGPVPGNTRDRTPFAWGVFLVLLGVLFLLQNIIPYYFLNRLWPVVFILLGGYLVWRSVQDRAGNPKPPGQTTGGEKQS